MDRPAKILVVDDDPDIVEAIKTVLEARNYAVVTARDGEECLQRIRSETPDLVVLDLLMPRKDGFAVCRDLKQDRRYAKYSNIPILVLTSVHEEASRRRYELETGLQFDVDDYVEKPIPPLDLLHRVEKLLQRVWA